jgi:hypothetical protein
MTFYKPSGEKGLGTDVLHLHAGLVVGGSRHVLCCGKLLVASFAARVLAWDWENGEQNSTAPVVNNRVLGPSD